MIKVGRLVGYFVGYSVGYFVGGGVTVTYLLASKFTYEIREYFINFKRHTQIAKTYGTRVGLRLGSRVGSAAVSTSTGRQEYASA